MKNLVEDKQEGEIKYWSYFNEPKDMFSKFVHFLKKYFLRFEDNEENLYSISVFCNPKDKIPYHEHRRTATTGKIIEGEGKMIGGDGKETTLIKNERFYILPNTPHKMVGDNVIVLNMETPPDKIGTMDDFIKLEEPTINA